MLRAAEPANLKRDQPIDFEKEILPIFKANCLACHSQTKPKGGLVLETPQTILKGGDSGAAVVPGKGAESVLLKAAAHQEPELIMPPRDNKVNAVSLTPEELGLLKLWIDQGAKGEMSAVASVEWQPLPESVKPIYAVAVTPDGQVAACGRANQIFVYHLPSQKLLTRVVDPKLTNSPSPLAHRDLVHALAFSPDGHLLASGGYREAKLWHRPGRTKKLELPLTNSITALAATLDGKWLVSGGSNGVIAIWSDGKEAKSFQGHDGAVVSLKIAGDRIASVGADQVFQVWSFPEGTELWKTNLSHRATALAWVTPMRIAVAGGDNIIRICAVPDSTDSSLSLIKELKGHEGVVTSLDTLGGQLLSGSADGTVRLWEVEKGEMIKKFDHGAPVTAVAARSDGLRFASAGSNNVAKIWNAADGKQVAELKGDRYAQEALTSSERDAAFARAEVAYQKSAVEAADKQLKSATERLTKATESVAAADKGHAEKQKGLQAATESKNAAEKALADINADLKRVTEEFQAAEQVAKKVAADAKAALETATQAKLLADQAAQTKAETERIAVDAAAVAARSKSAISNSLPEPVKAAAEKMVAEAVGVAEKAKAFAESAAADATAKSKAAAEAKAAAEKIIDEVAAKSFGVGQLKPNYDKVTAESPEKIKQANEKVTAATNAVATAEKEFQKAERTKSIADQELQLAKSSAEQGTNGLAEARKVLKTVEEAQKKAESAVEAAKKHAADSEKPILSIIFSPDNLTLATLDAAGKVRTWSAETGAAFESYPEVEGQAVAFNYGGLVVAARTGSSVVIWDLNPAWSLARVIGTEGPDSPLVDRVNAVRFSHDGALLATGGGEPSRSGDIKIWKVADGSLARAITNIHSDTILALDFSPDDKYLASGSADRFVRVTDLQTGKLVKSFEGHTHHVLGVSWKRDGRTLASSGADNIVKVWDFSTGERKKNIEGFSKEVTSVSFVGMDQALTSSGDNQVRLVRENGENVRSFSGPTDYVYSAAATPDGRIIVAGGQESTLHVWDGTDGKPLMSFGAAEKQ